MTTITGMQMALSFRDTALGPAFALLFRMGRGSWLGDTPLSCLQTWASSLPWPFGTVKKVQQVKVLAAKDDNLSCIPGTYMVKGKNQPCSLSSACHTSTSTLACTCEYTQNNKIMKNPLYFLKGGWMKKLQADRCVNLNRIEFNIRPHLKPLTPSSCPFNFC